MSTKTSPSASAVDYNAITPPESETELSNAPTPDTASGAINGDTKTKSTPSAELLHKLQSQVEFYFSPLNLQKDTYLISQMNSEKYVPIQTITNFPKISALTTDVALVAQSVSQSTVCSVDKSGTMIKPISFTPTVTERNIIILRDLKNSTEKDIHNLFDSNESCGRVVSLRHEKINNSWFVTMESEKIAKDSLLALRMGKGFNGVKILGALKTSSIQQNQQSRSSFGSSSVDAPAFVPSFVSAGTKVGQPKSLMNGGAVQRQNQEQHIGKYINFFFQIC
jgi:hypothetical protein